MAVFNVIFIKMRLLVVCLVSHVVVDGFLLGRSGGYPKFPSVAKCGQRAVPWHPEREARVVGGEVPPYGAVPWQVQLRNGDLHHCGGALISPRLVLTAAHCWKDDLTVVVGAHGPPHTSPFEQSFKIEKYIPHPDFRKLGPYSHDIAVLLLPSPGVNLNAVIQPACFATESPPPSTWCEVSGWGASDPMSPDLISPVLRTAAVPLLSLETCRKDNVYGGRQQQILDSMLCAGHLKGGIDACGGDSGGPLVCEKDGRHQLIGLVSWGDGCAKKDRPGVYTRVSSFLPWIRDVADKLGVAYNF